MSDNRPVLMWFRRDLRLSDHPALTAACNSGGPVIPVFINDEIVETTGAAARMRWGMSIEALAKSLEEKGSKLILRKGNALEVLKDLIKETGAGAVHWSRLYDPACRERDTDVKSALKDMDIEAESHSGHLLFEPWTVETKDGGFYKVYTPMWNAVKGRELPSQRSAPSKIPAPDSWPKSDKLDDWKLDAEMRRATDIVKSYQVVGETSARSRLSSFTAHRIEKYKEERDYPAIDAGSRLSENLTYGEIAPLSIWYAGQRAREEGKAGAEHFLKELVWREFAYHLIYHTPHITNDNWREKWNDFPWNTDERKKEVKAWKQGRTGEPFVDAAMREMWVTGTMHNRSRMIVASYLTKHLMTHWDVGMRWFEDCLTDWDPASNALGWQWTAGSGPDAAPYFRIYNPATQCDKFDENGTYRDTWIAEGRSNPAKEALQYFDAIPERWNMSADDAYPDRIIDLDEGRQRALDAYQGYKD